MNTYNTRIMAIDPLDGEMKEWAGPNIDAISFADARRYCRDHLGYCEVIGLLESEQTWNEDNSLTTTYNRLHKDN